MTRRPTPATPTAADPLIAIGVELADLWVHYEHVDRRDGTDPHVETERQHTMDRIQCLEAYATTIKASSVQGAMVQLGLLADIVGDVFANPLDGPEKRELCLRADRLMYSAFVAIAGGSMLGPNSSPMLGYYLSSWADPWTALDDRLADLKKIEEVRAWADRKAKAQQ